MTSFLHLKILDYNELQQSINSVVTAEKHFLEYPPYWTLLDKFEYRWIWSYVPPKSDYNDSKNFEKFLGNIEFYKRVREDLIKRGFSRFWAIFDVSTNSENGIVEKTEKKLFLFPEKFGFEAESFFFDFRKKCDSNLGIFSVQIGNESCALGDCKPTTNNSNSFFL